MHAGDPSPAAVGRMHALHRIAEHIEDLIAARPIPPQVAPPDREYLEAFNENARSVLTRLRNSPGFQS